MARITKNPEERRMEILTTASRLFNENGYEATSVNDIVNTINIAKGTFYYYFKSKEELLRNMIEMYVDMSFNEIKSIIENNQKSATTKIYEIAKNRLIFFNAREKVLSQVHHDSNVIIREEFIKVVILKAKPLFMKIVEQGKREGVLNLQYPEQTFEMVIAAIMYIVHEATRAEKSSGFEIEENIKRFLALEEMFNKVMGIEEKNKIKVVEEILVDMGVK